MAEIKREVADMPPKKQKELAAYLMHLRLQQDVGWQSEMTRRIDDKDSNNWVSLPEAKKRLAGSGKK